MSPPRLAAWAALCGTLVLAGWVAAGLLSFDPPPIENTGTPIPGSLATSAAGQEAPIEAPRAIAFRDEGVAANAAIVHAALPDSPMPRPEKRDECLGDASCIDRYLWSLYERAPKLDTIKVPERIKVTVKKKGKTRTVTKTIIKLVDEDFTWKDPKAAQKISMPLMDYVIGGMDKSFKLKLYHALRAMDETGFAPGITSGFRDDYRQSLATGNHAASDSSYHGGSRRGGYGHGLAADLVSVKGETRGQRWISSENMWKWIDTHEKEYGIGRPYLDRDPPHVGPIDGKEYADKRGGPNAQRVASATNKSHRSAARDEHSKKPARTASSKVKSI